MDPDSIPVRPKTIATIKKPPFLFRVASVDSRGYNDKHDIDPLDNYDKHYHSRLEDIPRDKLRPMLYDHILWRYKSPSEFSSWSISLLYVLIHAAGKHYRGEANIIISVMDTSNLPESRVYSSVQLLKDYDLEFSPKVKMYSEGEYLIHGKLSNTNGLWKAVDFNDLRTAGIFDIFPSLDLERIEDMEERESKAVLLYSSSLALRSIWFPRNGYTFALYDSLWTKCKKVAHCFGPQWEAIVAIGLVTTRRRSFVSEDMKVVLSELGSMQLPQIPWDTALRGFHITLSKTQDAAHFMQMLRFLDDM